jgi:hypothetical protein
MVLLEITAAVALASALCPVCRFCRSVWSTSLQSTALWAVVLVCAWLAAAVADWLGDMAEITRGHVRLLGAVIALMPGTAVLGARQPGHRAWNFIVLSLLGVFSLPILEQWVMRRPLESSRVGFDLPRFVFYAVVVAVSVGSYLPTRRRYAALLMALGVMSSAVAVGPWSITPIESDVLVGLARCLVGVSAWTALWSRGVPATSDFDRTWLRFRERWGVLWAQRVRERWNDAARHYRWPARLEWPGLVPAPDTTQLPQAAMLDQLLVLLRRFGPPEWFSGDRAC